ncbi:MAG: TonB-dependent receptor plug domain-containing protein [Bacteroidetes bacterium]|jgi:hypothetical protein|nr:TonB-dependent receptor plug domain-containing protein [Bacteroidota bacterium]
MFNKFRTIFQLLFTITFLLASKSTYGQSDTSFLASTVNKLNRQPAQEKVYLHLDRFDYGFGDTIWYKAYTVIGQHHQLSALSGVLYVELISSKDSLITRQIVHLISGIGWSDIPLPITLKQGLYRIRAYTRWMENFGTSGFYDQAIRIGGVAPDLTSSSLNKKPDIQFLPEGGRLVNGVRSKVAVKSVGVNGLGEDIKGTIEDNEGNIVADFATQHLGMGAFALTTQNGKTYKAKINIPGEDSFTVPLPAAEAEGYTLTLNNSPKDSIYIKVAVNEKLLNEQKDSSFCIIAQSNGKVYYTSQGKLENLAYLAKVEKGRFPTGVAQFTLFSQKGEPLAERLAFIKNADTLQFNQESISKNYTTRQKVSVSLQTENNSKPVSGSFSVAVSNESNTVSNENNESTILNNLLLTSELKGYIEQPNYYFTDVNEQKLADLDLLMLTQGYRRFEWKQVLNSPVPPISYQPEKTLDLSGTIRSNSNKPIPHGSLTLMVAKQNLLLDTTANESGRFIFKDLAFNDTTGLVLKARKVNGNDNIKITIDTPRYPVITSANVRLQTQPQNIEILKQQYVDYQAAADKIFLKDGKTLKQVNIKGYKRAEAPIIVNSANLNGPNRADQIIMGDKIDGCITISDCLQGKVYGVTFAGDGAPLNLRKSPPAKMTVIVDGIVLYGSHLNDLNASDIYSIEVLRSGAYTAIYGSIAGGGALVITMKHGGEGDGRIPAKPLFGLATLAFKGYYKAKDFYCPKYPHPKTDAEKPDLHNTIYWNPNIITDKDGKASFEYFNNDTKGTYRVVVEGIDDDGNLGRQIFSYEVK